jgi:hypothetical protein
MPDDAGAPHSDERRAEARGGSSMAMVSLNDLTIAINALTSQNIRHIVQASRGVDLERIAKCGCDGGGGDCGCFGSHCPCNKLHEGFEDIYSIDWFLARRQERIARLKQELQALEASGEHSSQPK